jgi:hypothetical protein
MVAPVSYYTNPLQVLLTNEWVESGINLSISRYSRRELYQNPVFTSQIHSPLLGDKVDYGIRLSYRPASLCSLTSQSTTL